MHTRTTSNECRRWYRTPPPSLFLGEQYGHAFLMRHDSSLHFSTCRMPTSTQDLNDALLECNGGQYPKNENDFTALFVKVFMENTTYRLPKLCFNGRASTGTDRRRVRVRTKWSGRTLDISSNVMDDLAPPTMENALQDIARMIWNDMPYVRNTCCTAASSEVLAPISSRCSGSAPMHGAESMSRDLRSQLLHMSHVRQVV